jgi:hypothetical protein
MLLCHWMKRQFEKIMCSIAIDIENIDAIVRGGERHINKYDPIIQIISSPFPLMLPGYDLRHLIWKKYFSHAI